mmetsp:Transcript_44326/g.70174  ORF Transcript_44326/g.70174 Transcript_44326/m.70174 type:complete len:204 (-) Transcript_44326:214-825(-)
MFFLADAVNHHLLQERVNASFVAHLAQGLVVHCSQLLSPLVQCHLSQCLFNTIVLLPMHQESCDAIWFAFCSFASDALAQFAELCHRLSLQFFLLLHDYSADFCFLRSSFCSRLCLMLEKSLDHGFLCSSCQAILCHKFFEISHVHRLQFFCPFDLYLFFFLGKSFLWADFFLFLLFLITILFLILLLLLVLFLFFYNVSLLF